MSDGQRSGRSTGRVSCKNTELKRCSMIEMRWNKYEVSLASPAWTQIRRPSSEIKFRVVELKTPRFSTATLYYYFIYLSISPEGQDQRRTNTDEHLKHFKIHIKPTLKYVQTLTSTKPTIYSNIALSTEKDRATTTCKVTKNLAKFGQMVWRYASGHRETYRLADRDTSHPVPERSNEPPSHPPAWYRRVL